MMGNPIEMDDLGVPPFKETPIVKTFGFTACFFFSSKELAAPVAAPVAAEGGNDGRFY